MAIVAGTETLEYLVAEATSLVPGVRTGAATAFETSEEALFGLGRGIRSVANETVGLYGDYYAEQGNSLAPTTIHFKPSYSDRKEREMAGRKRARFGFGDKSFNRPTKSARKAYKKTYARRNMRTAGLLGVEHKYYDLERDAAIVGSVAGAEQDPATINCLNAMAQGDGAQNREGRKIKINAVHLQGHVLFADQDISTPGTNPYVRIFLVLDTQTNATQMNSEDLLQDPSDADLDACAFRNLEYSGRFRVLKEVYVKKPMAPSVWDGTSSLVAGTLTPFEMHVKCNIVTHFVSSTPSVADISDNSLHVIAVGTNGISATLRYISRVRFFG